MLTRVLNDIGDAALWISTIGILVWIVQYTVLAKWWKNAIGVTLVGEAIALFLIYLPNILALADPLKFASFAQTRWYLYLSVGIVTGTAVFIVTRIITWEHIRRQREARALGADEITEL
jgi:hypothetical protein